jgi:hypothetical protein
MKAFALESNNSHIQAVVHVPSVRMQWQLQASPNMTRRLCRCRSRILQPCRGDTANANE